MDDSQIAHAWGVWCDWWEESIDPYQEGTPAYDFMRLHGRDLLNEIETLRSKLFVIAKEAEVHILAGSDMNASDVKEIAESDHRETIRFYEDD